ncbi:MAG: argininosuccinate lyase [Acidobacteriota bacterium]
MLRDRFDADPDELMRRFSSSIELDMAIARHDIEGSIAHARMLGEVGVLAAAEVSALCGGLAAVWEELREGRWVPGDEHEDIHMAVEARLTEHLGELGGKLHTARSRNDQVATDVRLWLEEGLAAVDAALAELIAVLLDRVEADGQTLIPGYTHLQRGQPILLGHHLLAHAWALSRDRGRLADALERLDECPLGACALAGTAFPIDRERTAELLEFARPVPNAMDAVAARDHEQEVAAACAICMGHLSRMAEELVLWSSTEFGLVRVADEFATGSSIMPQKRNPDAAELVRGKAARVQAHLQALLALTRAQPLAYNRDLQEGRAPLLDAVTTTEASLRIMAGVWRTLELRRDRFEEELRGDPSLATELADFLVRRGVGFRRAHGIVGRLARHCEERGIRLDGLTSGELAGFHEALVDAPDDLLDPRAAAERRTSLGGTAWVQVQRQLDELRAGLGDRQDAGRGDPDSSLNGVDV